MAESADDILQRELGKLGAAGSAVGGAVGGAIGGDTTGEALAGSAGGAAGGALGGGAGARFAGKLMKTDEHEAAVELELSAEDALRRLVAVLEGAGELQGSESPDVAGVRAVIGAGWLDMNPAVVDAVVESLGEGRSRVTLRGAAKEGLIKQHAGREAVERIAEELRKG